MVDNKIWLSTPHIGDKEKEFVAEAFSTNWVAPLGPNVDGFEQDLARFTGVKYAAALSSGTAALHLALVLLDVGPGDEVICQSLTFAASANPIVYQGATPVFVDSEVDTWNMCPQMLEKALKERLARGKKVKAIIPVHLYGMPANMPAIMGIAAQYNITVIEDAAESLGSHINGMATGAFSKFGILSFNGNKIITTSVGGALISNDEKAIEKAKFLATQARDPAPHYQHSHIGYNYRMSNICAGIGRGQMMVLEERIRQRRVNYDFYKTKLGHLDSFHFVNEPGGFFSNRWLSVMLVDSPKINREEIRITLEKENIECRPVWKPMHLQPIFKDAPFYGDGVSDDLFEKGLCLPSGSNLTEKDLDRVCKTILDILSK